MLIRSIRYNQSIHTLNISENYLTPACFHILRDVFLRQNKILKFKFYCASSDRLFNEMFLEMQRFYEELIRRGSQLKLETLVVSKNNPIDFQLEIALESSALYVGEGRQLSDIIFHVEKSKRYIEALRTVVIRGRLGESKEFAMYLNEFLKECQNL